MKTGNRSNSMKICRDEKIQDLQGMILFIEIFVNIKRFGL